MSIQLGPFSLLQPIGKGGMGVVWRAQHIDTEVQVAVKVITQRVSRDERTLSAFKNEVRAVAGLQHPGIVWVVDYGEVDHAAAVASEHQLVAGSPYLVMEMASGGTLSTHQNGMPWASLKSVLISLLDALAHAHARGVIHRDLKPGNILVCGPNDLRPGLKLTDFGIAHAREETVSHSMSNHVIGTLHYMAPEQIRADWRDYGPWTDLYALGTIAYRMATGKLPFKGKRGASLMVAQMNHRPPPLDPQHAMPDGFEDWLLTMMRKEHWRRFQCAADAALALHSLIDPPLETGTTGFSLEPVPLGEDLLDEPPTTLVLESTLEMQDSVEPTAELLPVSSTTSVQTARQRGELDRLRPPFPNSWARQGSVPADKLRGAGLGLWGLRSLPLVGRVRERDALWEAIRDVGRSRQARLVIVKGAKGVGKTALVQWIGERAVEIGAVHRLRCAYAADEGLDEGLRRMLRRFFRVARLDEEQRRQRVLDVLDTFGETDANEASRVEQLLDPVDVSATDGGGRHASARWLLSRVATDRPLLFWVDDAHHALDALKLVGSVLKAQKTTPTRMLTVLTIDPGALLPLEASSLKSLEKHPGTTVIEVPPLTGPEMKDLALRHMGLSPEVAERVVEAAQGVPQFAVQLVGDWIQKNALRRSPQGLLLQEGQRVPSSMAQVWSDRVAQVVGDIPEGGPLLERAAVLGMDVRMGEWERVGPTSKVRGDLVDRLLGMNLAVEAEQGFSFLHEELRATLLEQARQGNRLMAHHIEVVTLLQSGDPTPERLGMHLLGAGDLDGAVEALLGAVRNRVATAGPRAAMPLVELTERALTEASLPPEHRSWGRMWLVRAHLATLRGRLDPALHGAKKVEALAREHGWDGLEARSLFIQGRVALFRNEHAAAEQLFAAFERTAGSDQMLHRAAARHARALLSDQAKSHAVAAMEWLSQTEESLVDVWRVLGTRTLMSTRAPTLVAHLEAHGELYELEGKREGLGEAWTLLAAAMRRSKKSTAAVRALEQALRVYRTAGTEAAQRAQMQLAILKLGRGDVKAAGTLASEVVGELADVKHRKPVLLRAHATLAACTAATAEWLECTAHLQQVRTLVTETEVSEREVAWCLARAGETARKGDERTLAVFAWELAWQQYLALGDEGQARRLHTLIARHQ